MPLLAALFVPAFSMGFTTDDNPLALRARLLVVQSTTMLRDKDNEWSRQFINS